MTETETDFTLPHLLSDQATGRWLREIDQFLPIKSQFVLHGNIRDQFPWPPQPGDADGSYSMMGTHKYLVDYLALRGYERFFVVNPKQGISLLAPSNAPDQALDDIARWVDKNVDLRKTSTDDVGDSGHFRFAIANARWRTRCSFEDAVNFAEYIVMRPEHRCAVLVDYMMGMSEGGQTSQPDAFVKSLILSHEAAPWKGGLYSPIFWLCDRENDLPPWFTLNNPRMRVIGIPQPDGPIRTLVGGSLLRGNVPGFKALSQEVAARTVVEFGQHTDGLLTSDLEAIVKFMPAQGLAATEVGEAARRYKLGVTEDPWRRITAAQLDSAEAMLNARVRGQARAVDKAVDSLQRAIAGMSGAHTGRAGTKPKGVLFFAGPTGVGKTELAKSITEALFGDESAYIRFDMSEFNHEHSDQRLIGAPPGYVGYESGGELTDAIRARPFSVVLFDEIEKAHPRILDKFLQILDDGQLTSGKGERVYFSDALIIFTSNLGMGDVSPNDDYERLQERLRGAISAHFSDPQKLNRPELLGRIGDNIVIFDYIRQPIAIEILRKMVRNILARVREVHDVVVELDGFSESADVAPTGVFGELASRCVADLSKGGRGIGNFLETALIDPLSRALRPGIERGSRVRLAELYEVEKRLVATLEHLP